MVHNYCQYLKQDVYTLYYSAFPRRPANPERRIERMIDNALSCLRLASVIMMPLAFIMPGSTILRASVFVLSHDVLVLSNNMDDVLATRFGDIVINALWNFDFHHAMNHVSKDGTLLKYIWQRIL